MHKDFDGLDERPMGESVFWTNTEYFLLLNVDHTMSLVRGVKRTETARGVGCIYRD